MQARLTSQANAPGVTSLCARLAAVEDGVAALQSTAVAPGTAGVASHQQHAETDDDAQVAHLQSHAADIGTRVAALEARVADGGLVGVLQRLAALEAARTVEFQRLDTLEAAKAIELKEMQTEPSSRPVRLLRCHQLAVRVREACAG